MACVARSLAEASFLLTALSALCVSRKCILHVLPPSLARPQPQAPPRGRLGHPPRPHVLLCVTVPLASLHPLSQLLTVGLVAHLSAAFSAYISDRAAGPAWLFSLVLGARPSIEAPTGPVSTLAEWTLDRSVSLGEGFLSSHSTCIVVAFVDNRAANT